MAEVTFKFNDKNENDEIKLIVNRHKLFVALDELNSFYRSLYNGKLYNADIVTIKDNKVLTEEDYKRFQENGEYPVRGTKQYISTDYLEDELENVLSGIRDLLEY